jgi:hypothetical protein
VHRLHNTRVKLEPSANQQFVGLLKDTCASEKCFPNIFLGEMYFDRQRERPILADKLHKHLLKRVDYCARCNP